jgi:cytochrome oxidase Cu insertion factor (SCO1/SenC/PrrC family)
MRRKITMTIAAAAALWLIPLVSARFSSVAAAADDARWGADFFPNVTLTTHHGKSLRFYDDLIKGKIVAVDLIYTTCQYACPLETARLAQVQRLLGDRMGRDVFFYSITIDPEHDTPAVLNEYAEKYRAGPGWLFLTGKKADIDTLSKKLGLYAEPDPRNPDGHVPYLLVGNQATGQWMRNSALDNPKFIARTIGDWLNSWQTPTNNALKSYAEAPTRTFNQGQYTFAYHCSACHKNVCQYGRACGRFEISACRVRHARRRHHGLRQRDWLEPRQWSDNRVLPDGAEVLAPERNHRAESVLWQSHARLWACRIRGALNRSSTLSSGISNSLVPRGIGGHSQWPFCAVLFVNVACVAMKCQSMTNDYVVSVLLAFHLSSSDSFL